LIYQLGNPELTRFKNRPSFREKIAPRFLEANFPSESGAAKKQFVFPELGIRPRSKIAPESFLIAGW
jgi:hypothetical protein